jgi:putative ABC transport system permease protein
MMNKMVVSNLVHRPIRSLISIVAIALEVTLILLIVGLALGLLSDSRERQAGIGADVVIMPPGSSFIVGLTGAPMSIKVGPILEKLPHVTTVAPVVTHVSTEGTIEVIAGIDLNSYEKLSGPFQFVAGGPFQGPDDCLVDDLFARAKHVKVNDKIDIVNHSFRVAGIVEPGKGARKFLQIGVLQDLMGAQGKASIFYLKVDNPNNADEVANEVKAVPGMEHYVVTSMAYYLSMMTTSRYPGVSQFIDFVIAISVIIGFLVIFQSMYTAVMERTREIGILKSLGASKLYIVDVILRETVLLTIGGIVVGVLFSLAARAGIDHRSTLRVVVTGSWILRATAIAITGSVVGALYPAIKAAQKDPIDALAYE